MSCSFQMFSWSENGVERSIEFPTLSIYLYVENCQVTGMELGMGNKSNPLLLCPFTCIEN